MNKELAYLPIDIEIDWPDEEKILDWFNAHKLLDTDYWEYQENRHAWAMVSTCKEPKDWRRFDPTMWNNRRTSGQNDGILFHPGFEDEFPSLANCIRQLPFKQLTVSGFLYQLGEIPPHQDTFDPNEPTEPRRYSIYLTDPKYNTFYVSKDNSSKKYYPELITPCFTFNNSSCYHGAVATERPKIILTTAGIIDNDKHKKLLERSLEKYRDNTIWL